MKKLKFLGMAAAAAGMVLLTSCMDGNNERTGGGIGIVDTSSKVFKRLVYVGETAFPYYISNIANDLAIEDGSCVFFNITVNGDQPENANPAAYGYQVATLNGLPALIEDGNPTQSMLQDTTKTMEKELLVTSTEFSNPIKAERYEKMVLAPIFKEMLTDQKNEYFLSWNQTPEDVENERVYTLFLRCVKKEDGKAPTLNNKGELRAFDVRSFMSMAKSQEKAADKKVIYMRIAYASKFNSDSTKVAEWGMTKSLPWPILEEQ